MFPCGFRGISLKTSLHLAFWVRLVAINTDFLLRTSCFLGSLFLVHESVYSFEIIVFLSYYIFTQYLNTWQRNIFSQICLHQNFLGSSFFLNDFRLILELSSKGNLYFVGFINTSKLLYSYFSMLLIPSFHSYLSKYFFLISFFYFSY